MSVFALLVRPGYLIQFPLPYPTPGQSVYWQSMFQKSQDPTLVLLTFIWHTLYAWDEALEHLYAHICSLVSRVLVCSMECILTCRQESRVISTAEMPITRELHVIRAHHLHYISLLDHYTKHINFIKNTPNPAMETVSEEDRIKSAKLLTRECDNLLNEIERLHNELDTQERRLKNVMNLVSHITSLWCRFFIIYLWR